MLKKIMLTLLLLTIASFAGAQEIRVSAVQIDGNNRIETSKILAAVGIKPETLVTDNDLDKAVHRVFELGFFDDVVLELTEVQGAKILTVVVTELPLVRHIALSGYDELSKSKLNKLITIKVPSLYNRTQVDRQIGELRTAYIADGYHAAKIEPEIKIDENNEATLTFSIDEGEKVLIREITFLGSTIFNKKTLIKTIETKERWMWSWLTDRGTYAKEILDIDIERIKALYQDNGYQDVKVKQADVKLVDDEYFDIVIEIDEGPQYRFGKINITGDMLYKEERLLRVLSFRSGYTYSRSKLRDSLEALTDLYANSGYANANVAPLTTMDRKELLIDINLEVEQGVKVRIERVEIRGNTVTRDKVIRREIPIGEGSVYSSAGIKDTKRRINNLGFFEEVNVSRSPGSDVSQTVIDIEVAEKPTGTFTIGMGYSSSDGMMAQGSVSQNNLMGYGLRLELSGSFGSSSTTYSLGLSDPHFLDTDWTLGGEVYNTEREYDYYDEARKGGSIRTGHPVSRNSKAYLTYRYEQQEILNIHESAADRYEEGESVLSSLTTEWIRNSTDFYIEPSSGGISKISLEYAGLGGTENFIKAMTDHRHFFPLWWGTVFSIHGELGYVVSTDDEVVNINERFFLGGIKTIRGFEYRKVGPQDSGGIYIGGVKSAFFNFEYIFPIAKGLGVQGVLFFDAGNAWLKDEDYFTDMRTSVGAGIRWRSPMGPLRFEWGYNLDPREDEDQSVFEFTIGKAF